MDVDCFFNTKHISIVYLITALIIFHLQVCLGVLNYVLYYPVFLPRILLHFRVIKYAKKMSVCIKTAVCQQNNISKTKQILAKKRQGIVKYT